MSKKKALLGALEEKLQRLDFEEELCKAFMHLESAEEVLLFLRDLCTPQELSSMTERWKVCQLLDRGDLSYRDINQITSASLTTVGRVARFIKDESNHGYRLVLSRLDSDEKL